MQPRRSGRFDRRVEAEPIDYLLCPTRDLNDAGEICALPRIQIDNRIVRVLQRLNPGMPWVDGDGTELDRIKKREQIATDDPALLLSPIGFYQLDADLRRHRLRRLMLVEALPIHSIGESLENERPILDRWKDEVSDARVVTQHVTLGVLLLRKEDLVQIGDLERFSTAEVESSSSADLLDRGELPQDAFLDDFLERFDRRRRGPGGAFLRG